MVMEMNSRWIGMTIDSDLTAVATLALAVRGVLHEFDAEGCIELELCLVEAVNNAIEHAYGGRSGHRVRIYVAVELGEVLMAVIDNGRTMPPGLLDGSADFPCPSGSTSEELAERGMGLRLLKLVMDSVSYTSSAGVNRLVMRRNVRLEASEVSVSDLAAAGE